MPAGCYMQLDQKASEIVLGSLRDAIPSRWPAKVDELRSLRRERPEIDLAGFLEESGLDLADVYEGGKSWSDLREAAGMSVLPAGPDEATLRRAVGRLLHIDDEERISAYKRLLSLDKAPSLESLPTRGRRLVHMLAAAVTDRVLTRDSPVEVPLAVMWSHPQLRAELSDVLAVLEETIDHVHEPLERHPEVPLQIHARYSRIEILAAFGVSTAAKVAAWQSGVYEAKAANAELLAFTLDKSSGGFSPTTRYRDYAISRNLIHWESQSSTRADGPTGLRYRHHEREGRSIMLFARLRADDRAFWFLGPGTYRAHVGEKPMAITWELHFALPGDLYAAFAAAVA